MANGLSTYEVRSEERVEVWEASDGKTAMDRHLQVFPDDRLLSLRKIVEDED